MAVASRPPASGFVAAMRKVYNPIGFGKGYNAVLWFIFNGALMGFILARFMYFNFSGIFCGPGHGATNHAGPGECWSYSSKDLYKIGIQMHLYTILPAGFLAFFQFVPAIRLKAILIHRMNGYLVIALMLPSIAGALMIARVSFGGGFDTQVFIGFLAIIFLGSLGLAMYNIKKLQIEQHRAWMLRAWFYAGSIITCRIIMSSTAAIISQAGWSPYYDAMPCGKIGSFYQNRTQLLAAYPECTSDGEWATVKASLGGMGGANASAAFNLTFGMALWLALALHAIGIEVYLNLTPAESERLRNISYQRQMEAGFKQPGRAGLTSDRLGDSTLWTPTVAARQGSQANVEKDVEEVAEASPSPSRED